MGSYPVERAGGTVVMVFPAEVDVSGADQLRYELLSLIDGGATVIVADMSMTTFCDSAALTALVYAHKRAVARSADLRLVAVSAGVLRVIQLTGIDQLIHVYPTVAAAQAGPAPGR